MNELFPEAVRKDPYPMYARLRAESPVHWAPADLWLVLDHANAKRVLGDHHAFSSAASPPGSTPAEWLIFTDPPRHTKLRALIGSAFIPRAIAQLEPRIRTLSEELLAPHRARGEMDLVADYAVPLPLMVIAELLGAPVEDRPRFRAWSEAMLGLAGTVFGASHDSEAARAFIAANAEMNEYLEVLVRDRRRSPREDLLSRLVAAELEGERLSARELSGFFQLLLLAGHETTTNLISNAVVSLARHPDQRARLAREPALIASALEEILRYRAPVQVAFRVSRSEVTLSEKTVSEKIVPAGKLILVAVGAANRDPAQFVDPDALDVARDPNPHLAFGHGIHYCIGAVLARLEGRIALAELLRLRELTILDPDWEPRRAFHVHGPTRLPVGFQS